MSDKADGIGDLLSHGPWLEQLAHRLVQDSHAADDAVQSTWLNALRRPPETPARGRAWLRTVLLREVALAHRKRQRRRRHEELAAPDPDVQADPAFDAEAGELRVELVRALRSIPEPYRSTLHLHFFENLPSTVIAERLGIPSATVRWRLMTGLDRLREELRRRHPGRPLHVLLLPLTRGIPGASPPEIVEETAPDAGPRRVSLKRRFGAVAAALVAAVAGVFVILSHDGPDELVTVARAASPPGPDEELDSSSRTVDARTPSMRPTLEPSGSIAPAGAAVPAPVLFPVEVVDAFGLQRPDAAVLAFRRTSERFEEIGRTDARGRAALSLDPLDLGAWGGKGTAGRVALRASAAGWALSDVVFASSRRGGSAVRLVLPARETVFEGEVVDDRGQPVPGADVEVGYAQSNQLSGVVEADPSLPQPARAKSDERGRFRVEGVDGSLGRVRVHASRDGHVAAFQEEIVDGTSERRCRIVLSRGGVVRGRIRRSGGEPGASVRLWHEPAEQGGDAALRSSGYVPRLRGWSSETVADAEGRFELTAVPPGAQLLWAQDPACPREVASDLVEVVNGEATEWNAQLGLHAPVEIVLEGEAAGSAGWVVRLWFAGPDRRRCIREGVTDLAGSARFFDVCGAEIDVSVFAPDTGFPAARTHLKGTADSAVHVRVDPPGLVEGRVLDARGAPIGDGLLRLVPKEGIANWIHLPHDPVDGSFEYALPSGAYDLFVSRNGSNRQIASVTIAPGTRVDLGELRCPALGTLRIEAQGWTASEGLEYRILQRTPALPAGINARVEIGAWPPPLERHLLPGGYVLEVGSFLAKEFRLDRSFEVEVAEGNRATLRAGP